ncbi:COG1835 Predicted acyltransferases [Caulobacteraceae bacterium]
MSDTQSSRQEPSFTGAIPFKADGAYMPGLDGLRAISILIVVIAHVGFENLIPGGLGVTVFFFVSGFLITRILVAEQNQHAGAIDLPGFYLRRFLRLAPALLVFLLGSWLMLLPFGVKVDAGHVAAALFYFINYYDVVREWFGWSERTIPWGHLWSLAVEEHFYLLFPAALALFGKTHQARVRLVIISIVVCALWRAYAVLGLGLPHEHTYYTTDSRLENIAWGCLLAILLDGAPRTRARLAWLVGWHWVVLALGAILATLVYRDEVFRETLRYSIQGAALFLLVLNLYALRSLRFSIDLLELKPMRWIGRLSYSLYLWHVPIIWIVREVMLGDANSLERLSPLGMVIAVALSFACACASYYAVERPLFGLRKRFGGKPVETLATA